MELSTCGLIFYAVQIYPSIVIEDALQLLDDKMSHDAKWAQKMDVSRKNCIGKEKHTLANKTTPKVNGT